ncbi:alpha/beta hydrolase family protein [Nocardiopsis sediminis]|uniref:Alpha/beta hydrolase family protein n=1 Tax=Nocardiopsis sediminis TaxID=1778267 RepID=A0ABV8FUG9_9ACTN
MTASRFPFSRRRTLGVSAAAVLAAATVATLPALADNSAEGGSGGPIEIMLPEPTGRHDIGRVDLHLVDEDRADPWDDEGRPREIMASVWYPAGHAPGAPRAPYLSAGVADYLDHDRATAAVGIDPGEVDFAGALSNARTGAPVARGLDGAPVVLYSPGGGMSRAMGTTLVEELASNGYVVVTVDHTYQAPVQLPDRFEPPARNPDFTQVVQERVGDIRFVLDRLEDAAEDRVSDAAGRSLPRGLGAAMDLSRTGMFGHSAGGFATAEAMLADPRIGAGINMDGDMSPDYALETDERGTDRPFMLMSAGHNGDGDPHDIDHGLGWRGFMDRSIGWKRAPHLTEGEHIGYTDFQSVLPAIGRSLDLDEQAVAGAIGTVDPEHSLAAQRAYTSAFFDLHLRGRQTDLFDGPSPGHPGWEFPS